MFGCFLYMLQPFSHAVIQSAEDKRVLGRPIELIESLLNLLYMIEPYLILFALFDDDFDVICATCFFRVVYHLATFIHLVLLDAFDLFVKKLHHLEGCVTV